MEKGKIERAYVVKCGHEECRVSQVSYTDRLAQAPRHFRNVGWTIKKGLGWICPECAALRT
jgi:hypothetical protein